MTPRQGASHGAPFPANVPEFVSTRRFVASALFMYASKVHRARLDQSYTAFGSGSISGYLLWFVPREQLRLRTSEADLATYTFNTGKIRHHFCPHCGCAPFGVGADKSGAERAAVNVRCLEGVEPSTLRIVPFDGRSL